MKQSNSAMCSVKQKKNGLSNFILMLCLFIRNFKFLAETLQVNFFSFVHRVPRTYLSLITSSHGDPGQICKYRFLTLKGDRSYDKTVYMYAYCHSMYILINTHPCSKAVSTEVRTTFNASLLVISFQSTHKNPVNQIQKK